MQLNCKPGDLARIIPHDDGMGNFVSSKIVDKIVRVLNNVTPPNPECLVDAVWMLEEPISVNTGSEILIIDGLIDGILRPIRDEPGVDESLLWAPVSNTTKEKELE